jgi:queuosine precursor transporter
MTNESGGSYKYFDVICALFVAVLIISEIGATKIFAWGNFRFPGAVIVFPIAYIFGDILTEVYGYAKARRAIWIGFASLVLMALVLLIIQYLPAAPEWPNQKAYESILGFVPRIVVASIIAYLAGEFTNSFILAKMKVWTSGKKLWSRTIGSTIIGQAVDTAIFISIAFIGILPGNVVVTIAISQYLFKIAYETLATPLTYSIVNFLKRAEGIEVFDNQTNFNPFTNS